MSTGKKYIPPTSYIVCVPLGWGGGSIEIGQKVGEEKNFFFGFTLLLSLFLNMTWWASTKPSSSSPELIWNGNVSLEKRVLN